MYRRNAAVGRRFESLVVRERGVVRVYRVAVFVFGGLTGVFVMG